MFIWAGIDEAGYGPLLGPLVIAGACFQTPTRPSEGFLWEVLSDSLADNLKNLDGRLLIADSKVAYSRRTGLKHLEESVLSFASCLGHAPDRAESFLSAVCAATPKNVPLWFDETSTLRLPLSTNHASIQSKSSTLMNALKGGQISFIDASLCPVLPGEYNNIVARTGNKSLLLWQKCGLLLQKHWDHCRGKEGFVLVDRHGGRLRYRRLLSDAFPDCHCKVMEEGDDGSVYRLTDADRVMWVAFKKNAEQLSLPVSLASMMAKYVRELYMTSFNSYWGSKIQGLRPTAGYGSDAKRFLRDIQPMLKEDSIELSELVRMR